MVVMYSSSLAANTVLHSRTGGVCMGVVHYTTRKVLPDTEITYGMLEVMKPKTQYRAIVDILALWPHP